MIIYRLSRLHGVAKHLFVEDSLLRASHTNADPHARPWRRGVGVANDVVRKIDLSGCFKFLTLDLTLFSR